MSPGEPDASNVEASTDVEVQPALDYSTNNKTTIGAPVEKVCIYFLSPSADNRAVVGRL
jgi:hypothetical protein